ncbi:Microsomal glutathione S-transferase 1 [Pseudomonas reidholzensis]|uniref:Microsomal glutathione S-transferase 1 n=1 Tax=Pseudomonas reidholzensis TaxID=1785162 RepID=A0A383RUQ7_9PSED|nr:MAPEG family protein [Pseudomonas reidholzensis]SYX90171.1 Microsomal glutathione S-transferase 1 [Pseudomonas reidholzensis]
MNSVLVAYASCVLVLFVKMLALSCYQGFYRLRQLAFVNPEDAAVFGRQAGVQELPQVQRAAQAWANDLENIPLFFALGGLCVAVQTPGAATVWLCGGFTLARVLHSVAYLRAWQPWRTLAYAAGLACLLGMAGLLTGGILQGVGG